MNSPSPLDSVVIYFCYLGGKDNKSTTSACGDIWYYICFTPFLVGISYYVSQVGLVLSSVEHSTAVDISRAGFNSQPTRAIFH